MQFFYYSILCAFVSVLMFLYGFFIMNYDGEDSVVQSYSPVTKPIPNSVDKVVLLIIDGVRLDFITAADVESAMPYLYSSSKSNQTCIFPCRVHLPTVTMPRVKALTVGTVPSFVDIALNFGSPRLNKDNVIKQLVLAGKRIVFYGDDTWIKLFPDMFSRYEGTFSFFVSDFVEVDVNVTRNVDEEVKRNDWDVMILHYLGLDHIGHVEGSGSLKIPGKLREMDAIIEKLNRYLLNWKIKTQKNYLMVISGDHGMKDSGGHGGSSLPEVMVPFVTFGLPCIVHSEISQVDVAVTLSTLLGLPIPSGNVGKLIKGLLTHLNEAEKTNAYQRNADQLMNKFVKVANEFSMFEARTLIKKAESAYEEKDYHRAVVLYETLLNKICEILIRSLTKYDSLTLYCAVILAIQSCFLVGVKYCPKSTVVYAVLLTSIVVCLLYEFCYSFHCETMLCTQWGLATIFSWVILYLLSFNTVLLLRSAINLLRQCQKFFMSVFRDPVLSFLILGSATQICSSASTSFIEEEHMIWYFLWTTFFILIGLCYHAEKRTVMFLLSSLVLHRVLRKLNQTGDKWSALPDINDWFRIPENKDWLSVYTICGLVCTFFALNDVRTSSSIRQKLFDIDFRVIFKYVDFICLVLVFNCRAAVDEVIFPEKLKYILSDRAAFEFRVILILQITSIVMKLILLRPYGIQSVVKEILEIFMNFFMVWSALLLRPYNIILISSLFMVSQWLGEILKNEPNGSTKIVITHYWLAQVHFFYQGNSNSFSTIDVTTGFIGQRNYNPVVAGVLIIFSTYALPILAYACMIRHYLIYEHNSGETGRRKSSIQSPESVLLCLINVHLALFMTITTVQRNHLFIWSVFSPKMIYLCAYNVLMYAVLTCFQVFSGCLKN